MYVSVGAEIWVGVSEHPLGPWKNAKADNTPLVRHKEYFYVQTIDAECFIDDDGQAYLYWGSAHEHYMIEGRCLAVKLDKDMVTFMHEPKDVTPTYFYEAPHVIKKDGVYYLTYSWGRCWDHTYQVRYATGETPFGPWVEGKTRPILSAPENDKAIAGTGHHTLLNLGDKYYIVYHRLANDVADKNLYRQISIDEMKFNADGSIQKVITTHKGVNPVRATAAKRTNLAFAKKAADSSSSSKMTEGKFAIDHNYSTRWLALAGDSEPWLEIDLGKEMDFDICEIKFEYAARSYKYKIETSNDSMTWEDFAIKSNDEPAGSPRIHKKESKARYLRISFELGEDSQRPGIWELAIY